jgi:major membrane immunogen (membrane-anchored lipoprotein)
MSNLKAIQNKPEGRQLYSAILRYMLSDKFKPMQALTPGELLVLFKTKKSITSFLFGLLITMFISTSVLSQDLKVKGIAIQDTSVRHKDGTYEGKSRAKYKLEPFWGIVHLTLKNGKFTDVNFVIRDSNLHETFDGKFEKHFEGNTDYIQQSRNDWKGVQTYPKMLSEKQDIIKVDAISGATWSYNIFKASINEALKNAK